MAERKTCCCGCFYVRTGTIIIATFWLILAVWNVFACSSQLAVLTDKEKYDVDELIGLHAQVDKEQIKELYINHRTLATILTVLVLIGELINAPLSAFCLHGAVKRGPAVRLQLWIYYNAFCAVLSALFTIVMGIYLGQRLGGAYGFAVLLAFLLVYGPYCYLIRVVYYYMEEIRQAEAGRTTFVRQPVTFDGVGVGFIGGSANGNGDFWSRGPPPPYQEKADQHQQV